MPKTVGDYLNEIAKRTGQTEAIKDVLANAELAKVTLPDTFTNEALSLMTVEQATANYDVKSFFQAQLLDPIDANLKKQIEGVDDADFLRLFQSEKSTYKKQEMVDAKLKELTEAKIKAATTGKQSDKDEVTRLYNEAVNKLKEVEGRIPTILSEKDAFYNQKLYDLNLNSTLSGFNWGNGLPPKVNAIALKTLLEEEGKSKGYVVKYENDELRIVNAKDHTLPYLEQNEPVTITKLAERLAAANSMVKVNGTPPPPVGQQNNFNQNHTGNQNNTNFAPERPKMDFSAVNAAIDSIGS